MLGEKLDDLIKNGQYSIEYVADYLGVSKGTIYNWIKKHSAESKNLEQLSKLYNLPISYFFDEKEASEINGDGNISLAGVSVGRDLKNSGGHKKNGVVATDYERILEEKERLIAEKDKRLQVQEEMIELLKNVKFGGK